MERKNEKKKIRGRRAYNPTSIHTPKKIIEKKICEAFATYKIS